MEEQQLENAKIKLFRLHFLLTEPQTDEIIEEALKQFELCFSELIKHLSEYLEENAGIKSGTSVDVFENAFKKKLFTQDMTEKLKNMAEDFNLITFGKEKTQIFEKVRDAYAHYLQVIYDMLIKMGQDAEDEE
jgi:hypothetical protein